MPMPSVDTSLAEKLAAFVGAGADREGLVASAPVSQALITQMTNAVGDRNPIYSDEEIANRSVHRGIVAPPLWLYSWMMAGLESEGQDAQLEDGTPYFYAAPGGQRRVPGDRRTIRD